VVAPRQGIAWNHKCFCNVSELLRGGAIMPLCQQFVLLRLLLWIYVHLYVIVALWLLVWTCGPIINCTFVWLNLFTRITLVQNPDSATVLM
jgi:hypothetical protein